MHISTLHLCYVRTKTLACQNHSEFIVILGNKIITDCQSDMWSSRQKVVPGDDKFRPKKKWYEIDNFRYTVESFSQTERHEVKKG